MKKLLVAVATVVAVGAVLVGTVSAAGDGPKLVDSGFLCGILDGNGNIVEANGATEWWVTANGQGIIKCSGTVDRGAGPWPIIETGFDCNTFFGFTTNSFSKVGYNGFSQLTCKASAPAPDAAPSSGGIGAVG